VNYNLIGFHFSETVTEPFFFAFNQIRFPGNLPPNRYYYLETLALRDGCNATMLDADTPRNMCSMSPFSQLGIALKCPHWVIKF